MLSVPGEGPRWRRRELHRAERSQGDSRLVRIDCKDIGRCDLLIHRL